MELFYHFISRLITFQIPFDAICARLQAPAEEGDEEEKPDAGVGGEEAASWSEQQMLKNACQVLKACRTTLMYTYVFAFYLQDDNESAIFEVCRCTLCCFRFFFYNMVKSFFGFFCV